MFKAAKKLEIDGESEVSAAAVYNYRAAIAKYTQGIELTPTDHRLYSNRGMCYLAIKDWANCHADAQRATNLKPDFMKGWFLLVKSTWKEGNTVAALNKLDVALSILPGCPELLSLKAEMAERPISRGRPSRNVSPCGHRSQPSTPPGVHRAESCPPTTDGGGRASRSSYRSTSRCASPPKQSPGRPPPWPRGPSPSQPPPPPWPPPAGNNGYKGPTDGPKFCGVRPEPRWSDVPPPVPRMPPRQPPVGQEAGAHSEASDFEEVQPPPSGRRSRRRHSSLSGMAAKSRMHAEGKES